MSTGKWYNLGECRKSRNPGEYQKGRIRASTEKVGSERVLEKGPGEYRKGGIRASTGGGSR